MRWLLIFFLALLLATGLPGWLRRIGLGRLPGDLHFVIGRREFKVPFTSALLLSLLANWAIHLS